MLLYLSFIIIHHFIMSLRIQIAENFLLIIGFGPLLSDLNLISLLEGFFMFPKGCISRLKQQILRRRLRRNLDVLRGFLPDYFLFLQMASNCILLFLSHFFISVQVRFCRVVLGFLFLGSLFCFLVIWHVDVDVLFLDTFIKHSAIFLEILGIL